MTTPTADEKNWAILAHVGPIIVSFFSGGLLQFLVPLIILLIKREDSEFVAHHARQSINFQLTLFVLAILWWVAIVLSFVSLIAIPMGIVMACLAKDPAERPGSADALAASLRGCDIVPWTPEQAQKWWQVHRPD